MTMSDRINMGYGVLQLMKCSKVGNTDRAEQWNAVLNGLTSGSIDIGSRQPTGDPVWVTLRVLRGGFAVPGEHMAGGSELPYEKDLLNKINVSGTLKTTTRGIINLWSLSSGSDYWLDLLNRRLARIDTAEQGCILAIIILLQAKMDQQAEQVLTAVQPYFPSLRFFPRPESSPMFANQKTFLRSVGKLKQELGKIPDIRPPAKHSLDVVLYVIPIYDQIVDLVLCTIPKTAADGRFIPLRKPPNDYLRAQYTQIKENIAALPGHLGSYSLCTMLRTRSGGVFLRALKEYFTGTMQTGRDMQCFNMLSNVMKKRERRQNYVKVGDHAAWRNWQKTQAQKPLRLGKYRDLLQHRIAPFDDELGIKHSDMQTKVLCAINNEEEQAFGLPCGEQVHKSFLAKVKPSLMGTLKTLNAAGVFKSPETLAKAAVIPTCTLRAYSIENPQARALYSLITQAFCRRRSLLLRNLSQQVTVSELPWVKALEEVFMVKSDLHKQIQELFAKKLTTIYLTSWPHRELPNELMKVYRSLGITPMLDAIAADIFEGTFGAQYLEHAQRAAEVLKDTLYCAYYELDGIYKALGRMKSKQQTFNQSEKRVVPDAFMTYCRVSVVSGLDNVAANGAVIERCAILTTHNLLFLLMQADLHQNEQFLMQTAVKSLGCMSKMLREKNLTWHAQLILDKNVAIAWRQLILYISLASKINPECGWDFVRNAESKMSSSAESDITKRRLNPLLQDLKSVVEMKSTPCLPKKRRSRVEPFCGWGSGNRLYQNDPLL